MSGTLEVTGVSASNLPNIERFSKSDPRCFITFRGVKEKTEIINNNLNPKWKELQTLKWDLKHSVILPTDVLQVGVYDHDLGGYYRPLGFVDVSLRDLLQTRKQTVERQLQAKEGVHMRKKPKNAMIHLELSYTPPRVPTQTPTLGQEVGGAATEEGGVDEPDVGEEEGVVEGKEEEGEVEEEQRKRVRGKGKVKGKGVQPTWSAYQKTERKHWKRLSIIAEETLPKRPMDFHVRVHIIEVRHLVGDRVNPVVKVSCGKNSRDTARRRNVYFNETLVFNLHELPSEMLDRVVDIKVLNAKSVRSDALIGSFRFDLRLVYDEEEHSFIHKWLMLTDPNDRTGAATGYLKISIMVMGPGDAMKHSPPDMSPEDVDIEANLLRPSGAQLQPAVLSVKIYRAEDLPQMDPGYYQNVKKVLHLKAVSKGERIDPYCTITYGGHKGLTPHCEHSNHPEWNYQISLRVRFPTMCERMQLQLVDRDTSSEDDIIGTAFLHMSHISRQGEDSGFLPTFGPSFINVYGSPREFVHLPNSDHYENMNKGKLEGVSYRGRVLVEVEMKMDLGDLPIDAGKEFRVNETKMNQLLCSRRFKLYAAFFSATMIHPAGDPVMFEVSIGNYGKKQEEKSSKMLSTTPPNNPIRGGRGNYFLPWRDKKPCVLVEGEWEDCLHRIYSLNMLLYVTHKLEEGLTEVRKMSANVALRKNKEEAESEAEKKLNDTLKTFLQLITPPEGTEFLPTLPKDSYTDLDKKLREYRLKELERLREGLSHLLDATSGHSLWSKLDEGEFYLAKMKDLTIEPQNSIPDVVIWMLSDDKRVACHRIPSHFLMHSDVGMQNGRLCGKRHAIFLTPPTQEETEKEEDKRCGAQVRVMLWLEPEVTGVKRRAKVPHGAKITSYAETYANEMKLPQWTLTSHTDATGEQKLPPDDFELPEGWKWVDDKWFSSPELSIEFDPDIGLDEWEEEIFEYQSRLLPFSKWNESYWRDKQGEEVLGSLEPKKGLSRDDIRCPRGWDWKKGAKWEWEKKRPEDDGWEYSVDGHGYIGAWHPYERKIHFVRRRRWTRMRVRVEDPKTIKQSIKEKHRSEGWEYATIPYGSAYHVTQYATDLARRKRLLRRIEPLPGYEKTQPILTVGKETQIPRMYLSYKESECMSYQLRAHLFQARDLYGSDRSGLSDPYAVVKFGRYTKCSRKASETVCPKWDHTLVFRNMELYGDPVELYGDPADDIFSSPPLVVVEFFDKDKVGTDDFIGSVVCRPTTPIDPRREKPLQWYEITRKNKPAGQLLAFFELLEDDGKDLDFPTRVDETIGEYFMVPFGVRPETTSMRIEVLCWGVRDMKRLHFMKVTTPFVEVECGGNVSRIPPIENATKNPNFPSESTSVIKHTIDLPKEIEYAPPLNIRVHEKRKFGITPLVGVCSKSLEHFKYLDVSDVHRDALAVKAAVQRARARTSSSAIDTVGERRALGTEVHRSLKFLADPDKTKSLNIDWWSRYYYSIGKPERGYDPRVMGQMVFYKEELEKTFDFQDLVQTFPLFRGKGSHHVEESPDQIVGYFKGAVKVYPPEEIASIFPSIPSTKPVDLIVRVYIIAGFNLQPKDPDGKSDPYIIVKVGKEVIDDRDKYIPGDLDPIFGRVYELPATLPIDHTLTITVMDWDRVTADDLIGSTEIDLEDRFLSGHRATCGLSDKYFVRGPFKWRDRQLPSEILEQYCREHNMPKPEWSPNEKVWSIGQVEHKLNNYEPGGEKPHPDMGGDRERLALYIIRGMTKPELVLEHIETRILYSPLHPKVPQGGLHMWVDIFEDPHNIPPPVDISPREAEKYVLRVIVWNTKDVVLDDQNPLTQESMSDIYVKGWLRGQDKTQKTDVHYRSMDGEGNFNWRLVFPFEYMAAEQMMVVRKSEHFYSLTKTARRLPARLTLQVWDNDLVTRDDFLGTIDFDLHSVPRAASSPRGCRIELLERSQLPAAASEDADGTELETIASNVMSSVTSTIREVMSVVPVIGRESDERVNLFQQKRIKGWWPVVAYNKENNELEITGKLELELELLREEEANARPAGKGREEPNMNPHLEEPNRPATSFLWITSPWKTLKFIVWKNWKWYIIGAILLILIILLIVLFVYTIPSTFSDYLVDRILP